MNEKQNNCIREWYVYILQCSDHSLYTGITNDINRRIKQHNAGKGAKYTRIRRPVKLAAFFFAENRSLAAKEEYRIKQLSRPEKLKLCEKQSILKNML